MTESPCPLSSLPPSETISFSSCTPILPRTEDKLMEFISRLDISTQPNLGEQEEQWLESPEFQDPEQAEVDREPSVTSAEREECSLP